MRLLCVLIVLAFPASALASSSQEATFQDDNHFIYATPEAQAAALAEVAALGADRIRATILWEAIAPDTRPADPADPDSYPPGTWTNYDNLVRAAQDRGLKLNFNVTGPSPVWANKKAPRPDIQDNYEPSPEEFEAFVRAVARRYSGTWPDGNGGSLPRVDYWSIWNEPNHSGWLTPTWDKRGGVFVERSASLYRELLDAAWRALQATGHGADTILFGETAPSGNDSKEVKRFMKPLTFLRALYCVDLSFKRLKGRAAKRLNCPSSASRFADDHPALFRATGYAHHPYQLLLPPNVSSKDPAHVTIGSLSRLTRALDKIQRRYGQRKKFPIYLTEFGYQTKPDGLGVPFSKQAAFINQGEFIAARNRRVRTLSQFLLVDDGEPVGTTFQSGLKSIDGKRKPAYAAYRIPIWVRSGRVWGLVRPTAAGASVDAQIQFRAKGSSSWQTVRTVRTKGKRNVVSASVSVGKGRLRIKSGDHTSRAATAR